MKALRMLAWVAVAALVLGVSGPDLRGQQATGGQPLKKQKVAGYAEWRRADLLIVDGQRLRATTATKFKGKGITAIGAIPLGYEVEASGLRLPDGVIQLESIEAKPNGNAAFENDIRQTTDQMEATWLRAGRVYEPSEDGKEKTIGNLVGSGPHVARVQQIVSRVRPPYVAPDALRVHVVDTKDWNAMAMGNGAIWVFTGLLNDLNDDEIAIIVGHELAHYTHEHSRKEFKRAMWGQLIALGAIVATEVATDNDKATAGVAIAGMVAAMTIRNGYSRNLEDQADRVGLRYAYEGGYDVRYGPQLWVKFREKYGEQNGLLNFFLGEHSQASDRIKKLEREIVFNYASAPRR